MKAQTFWLYPAGLGWSLHAAVDGVGEDSGVLLAGRIAAAVAFALLWYLHDRRKARRG